MGMEGGVYPRGLVGPAIQTVHTGSGTRSLEGMGGSVIGSLHPSVGPESRRG